MTHLNALRHLGARSKPCLTIGDPGNIDDLVSTPMRGHESHGKALLDRLMDEAPYSPIWGRAAHIWS